jgi:hypothetical protein
MDELTLTEADWKLLDYLKERPHPNLREVPLPHVLHSETGEPIYGVDEVLQETRVAHHLLDYAGIPRGKGYSANLDARVALLLRLANRLHRIATMHQPDRNCDGHGGNSGYCVECEWAWPCATTQAASGERDDEV